MSTAIAPLFHTRVAPMPATAHQQTPLQSQPTASTTDVMDGNDEDEGVELGCAAAAAGPNQNTEAQSTEQPKNDAITSTPLSHGTSSAKPSISIDSSTELQPAYGGYSKPISAIEHVMTDIGARTARQSESIIRGIPLRGNESEEKLRSYVAAIASFIGFALHPTFVLSATIFEHRQKSGTAGAGAGAQRRGFPSMLVRFLSEPVRRGFFLKYLRSRDGLRTKLLGFDTDSRIYIVDNLTRLNEEILRKAKALKMSGHLRRAKVRHGAVLVTNNDGHSKAILSTDEQSVFAGIGH